LLSKRKTKQIWRELLSPLRWKAGSLVFHYFRREKGKTKQYRIEYDFYKKKWRFRAFVYNPKTRSIWRNARTNKYEREIMKEKMLRTIKRELKRMGENHLIGNS